MVTCMISWSGALRTLLEVGFLVVGGLLAADLNLVVGGLLAADLNLVVGGRLELGRRRQT